MPIVDRIAELDEFDLKILSIVQTDNLTPHRVIANAVNLSVPSVARRLQRLRANGVIAADRSVLRPESVGALVTVVVHVAAESEAIELLDAMKARFQACPQVQQCYYVIMATRDMQEYSALTRSLFFEEGNVRHFRTFVAMERVKVSLNVPIDAHH
jgi:Lrp/AsnC family leucine-responsive transcriptional regulator